MQPPQSQYKGKASIVFKNAINVSMEEAKQIEVLLEKKEQMEGNEAKEPEAIKKHNLAFHLIKLGEVLSYFRPEFKELAIPATTDNYAEIEKAYIQLKAVKQEDRNSSAISGFGFHRTQLVHHWCYDKHLKGDDHILNEAKDYAKSRLREIKKPLEELARLAKDDLSIECSKDVSVQKQREGQEDAEQEAFEKMYESLHAVCGEINELMQGLSGYQGMPSLNFMDTKEEPQLTDGLVFSNWIEDEKQAALLLKDAMKNYLGNIYTLLKDFNTYYYKLSPEGAYETCITESDKLYEGLPKHSKDILALTAAKRQGLVHDLVSEVFQFQEIARDLWGIKQLLCIYLRPVKEWIEKNFSQQVQSRVSKKASQVATTASVMLSLSSTLSSSSPMASSSTGQSFSSGTASSVTETQSHTGKHKLEGAEKTSILEKDSEKEKKPKLSDANGNSSGLPSTNNGLP